MASLEKIYYSGDSYRMAEVKSKVTTILVNVYKMVKNLRAMAPESYHDLEVIFEKISAELEQIIQSTPPLRQGPFILPLAEVGRMDSDQVGEKMAHLGEVSRLPGFVVPPGFIITASATRSFLTSAHLTEIDRILQVLSPDKIDDLYRGCEAIRSIIINAPLSPELENLLLANYHELEKVTSSHCRVAMRSSAFGEDSRTVSFAGLYRSVLNVNAETIGEAYKAVIASKYGPKAIAYRRRRGFRHVDVEMCVGCMVMVDALVSGVIYSRDPDHDAGDVLRINATRGISKGVVDGTASTDLYLVSRDPPHQVVYSEIRQGANQGESDTDRSPVLGYSQLRNLTGAALLLEQHFNTPQDIEWSYDHHGTLYILQSRPLQMEGQVQERKEDPVAIQPVQSDPPILSGGICAARGIAAGVAIHVTSTASMHQFPKGGILIVAQPLPEWAPLLNKASGLIAESGSEAGHLATVSREYGIPALFSVPNAMKLIENGSTVTLHSAARTVYGGRREDLLRNRGVKKDLMTGSPVQRILTEALQRITPLNLNDPASSHFKSSWCETLHDITRFCHEKSVSEMFNFSRQKQFDQSSARRLVGNVPLEWWVINLADGYRPGVAEKEASIRIEDIVSTPMLAIWKGISAFNWQGPPPVSLRGFGSIIFQSTMRPELDPAVASRLTTKNYFLISKQFCNLSVRLGYHYAMIEAYISDLRTESYITFRFKGGAADLKRKAVRARLLADILQRYDFRIELQSDALLARIKKESTAYLEQRLQILGYLTLHARQLDMIMNQPGAVEQYREKFIREIEEMLAQEGTGREEMEDD